MSRPTASPTIGVICPQSVEGKEVEFEKYLDMQGRISSGFLFS